MTTSSSITDAAGATSGANNANSCAGCRFGAADRHFSWVLKNDSPLPGEQ